jgi:hypothetical protein
MVTTKTSFSRYLSLNPFPGTLFYFMIQPFGILLEPLIIPLIPESLGGGTLWVWAFSLLVITPYRKTLMGEFGAIDDALPPLSKWPIYSFFIPGTLYNIF